MASQRHFTKENILFVTLVMWMILQVDAEEHCFPGGTQIFRWKYASDATRLDTSWYYNGIQIMQKTTSGVIHINTSTQFADRIWEYNETNCGLIIFDVRSNDTGMFEVFVKFDDGSKYTAKENLSVSVNAAKLEVETNAEIFINDAIYEVPDDNYLGEPPLNFTFGLTKACIPAPVIRIQYNTTEVRKCADVYSCAHHFEGPGGVTLTITIGTENIPYPPTDEKALTIAFNETDLPREPNVASCREKVECIVPATVVPIGCVLFVVITTLAIKKPCSE